MVEKCSFLSLTMLVYEGWLRRNGIAERRGPSRDYKGIDRSKFSMKRLKSEICIDWLGYGMKWLAALYRLCT